MEKFVQVPEIKDLSLKKLKPKDLLVYAAIAKFKNSKTNIAYPKLKTISAEIGLTAPTITKAIESLQTAGLLTVITRKGTTSCYKFTPYESFQGFSHEFLNQTKLTAMEKAYIISIQDKLFLNEETRNGTTNYSNTELSQYLNLDRRVISKIDKSLQNKGILELVKINSIDSETGLVVNQKIFSIDEFANGVVFELQKHRDYIADLQKRQQISEEQIQQLADQCKKMSIILKAKDVDIENLDEEYHKVNDIIL